MLRWRPARTEAPSLFNQWPILKKTKKSSHEICVIHHNVSMFIVMQHQD